jgi:hypothetical protein
MVWLLVFPDTVNGTGDPTLDCPIVVMSGVIALPPAPKNWMDSVNLRGSLPPIRSRSPKLNVRCALLRGSAIGEKRRYIVRIEELVNDPVLISTNVPDVPPG